MTTVEERYTTFKGCFVFISMTAFAIKGLMLGRPYETILGPCGQERWLVFSLMAALFAWLGEASKTRVLKLRTIIKIVITNVFSAIIVLGLLYNLAQVADGFNHWISFLFCAVPFFLLLLMSLAYSALFVLFTAGGLMILCVETLSHSSLEKIFIFMTLFGFYLMALILTSLFLKKRWLGDLTRPNG